MRKNNAAHKDVHALIPRPYYYVLLQGKEELKLQMELRLLVNWPRDEEMILYYLSEANVITRIFISGKGRQKSHS